MSSLLITHHVVLDYARMSTRHVVLDAELLLIAVASIGDACGAGCGAAAAFSIQEHTILALSMSPLLSARSRN